ncbi:MAG: histidine--tRNA ligase [Candidatus Beckwithbacteria bacterium]
MTNKLITPKTLKGFRDFLPEEALKRQYALDIIRRTFELYGFEPLETPAVEYLETFKGQIGEDEKLFFKFIDQGGREVALRYDQTVPTCRVIAQYSDKITLPFKRYQIQTVWRSEKPQKGRYREFLQCDGDIFGVDNRTADGETIALTIDIFKNLGFKKPLAIINDRKLYQDIPYSAIVAIDKLDKLGEAGVIAELKQKGFKPELLDQVRTNQPNQNLKTIFAYLDNYGFQKNYQFKPTLARSFSYSTGTIWEIIDENFSSGSLAGCERFDSLVAKFSNRQVPAVGFGIGFDRTILAMEELKLFPLLTTKTKVLITIFSPQFLTNSQKICQLLRQKNINTDIYPDSEDKLAKQFKYASDKTIPYVLVIGETEAAKKQVTLKNMATGKQETLSLEKAIDVLAR